MQKLDFEKAANMPVLEKQSALEKQKEGESQSTSEKLMPSLDDFRNFNSKDKTTNVQKCEPDFLPIDDGQGIFFKPTEKRKRNDNLAKEAINKGEDQNTAEPTQGESMLGKAMADHARTGFRHKNDSPRELKKQSHSLDVLEEAFKTLHPETADHVITAANRDLAKDGLRLARTTGGETWLGEYNAKDGVYNLRNLIAGETCIDEKQLSK